MKKTTTKTSKIAESIDNLGKLTQDDNIHMSFKAFPVFFEEYLKQKHENKQVSWENVKTPAEKQLIHFESFQQSSMTFEQKQNLLKKIIVMKLNGGLGTTMGCKGPKSTIVVKEDLSFLQISMEQIKHLQEEYKVKIPLVLMNSFNTDKDTKELLKKSEAIAKKSSDPFAHVDVFSFNQNQFPRLRIEKDGSLSVFPDDFSDQEKFYPPGHGDVYQSFYTSPLFKQFVKEGRNICFLSNIDNLGATIEVSILNEFCERGLDFCMEVTPKTLLDVKGGTLIDYEGKIRLLEIAEVPKENIEEFKSINKFKVFNTNNLWFSLTSMEKNLLNGALRTMGMIENKKIYNGVDVMQLEQAAGSAINIFQKAVGVVVPRTRFLPVKTCSDLMLILSDLFKVEQKTSELVLSQKREAFLENEVEKGKVIDLKLPLISLCDKYYKNVGDFMKRFAHGIPDITELVTLNVDGNVFFGKNISLRGKIEIIKKTEGEGHIPDGTIIENQSFVL